MVAAYAIRISSCLITCLILYLTVPAVKSSSVTHDIKPGIEEKLDVHKIKLYDGLHVTLPKQNGTEKLLSFEIQTKNYSAGETGRGKKKKLLERLLPMFIIPFLIQSTIVPFFLSMLKFMLFKSMMVGKLALALIVINAFKNSNSFKGRDAEMANVHYGYHGNGMEEYGAYFN